MKKHVLTIIYMKGQPAEILYLERSSPPYTIHENVIEVDIHDGKMLIPISTLSLITWRPVE